MSSLSSVVQSCRTLCNPMDCSTPGGLQHARPPCPSPNPRAHSNLCPSRRRCHPTISSSVVPFSYCLQSFPSSGSFPMSQFFASSGQSIGVSASASVLPRNIEDWSPLGWTGWISLQSKGLSRVFSNTNSPASILQCSAFFIVSVAASQIFHCGARTLVVAQGLSCSEACGILVPWAGIEPTYAALQGRFLTTGPLGSPWM